MLGPPSVCQSDTKAAFGNRLRMDCRELAKHCEDSESVESKDNQSSSKERYEQMRRIRSEEMRKP